MCFGVFLKSVFWREINLLNKAQTFCYTESPHDIFLFIMFIFPLSSTYSFSLTPQFSINVHTLYGIQEPTFFSFPFFHQPPSIPLLSSWLQSAIPRFFFSKIAIISTSPINYVFYLKKSWTSLIICPFILSLAVICCGRKICFKVLKVVVVFSANGLNL